MGTRERVRGRAVVQWPGDVLDGADVDLIAFVKARDAWVVRVRGVHQGLDSAGRHFVPVSRLRVLPP